MKIRDILETRFSLKHLTAVETSRIIKDVIHILDSRGPVGPDMVNHRLAGMGWPAGLIDNATFDLITWLTEDRLQEQKQTGF